MGFMKMPSIPSVPEAPPPVKKEEVMKDTVQNYNARLNKRRTLLSTALKSGDGRGNATDFKEFRSFRTDGTEAANGQTELRKTLG